MVVKKYDEIPITGKGTFLKRLTGKVTPVYILQLKISHDF